MFRCNIKSQLWDLFDQTCLLASRFGAYYDREYVYAGYTADTEHSEMLKLWQKVYRDFTGKELYLKYTHGGSDIGSINDGMGGIDAIVVSPDIKFVHRPQRPWTWLPSTGHLNMSRPFLPAQVNPHDT